MLNVVEKMMEYVSSMKSGDAAVKPGQPERFTEACTRGDTIQQGDVNFTIVDKSDIPSNFVDWKPNKVLQLVHGGNVGSMHCLDSMDGVTGFAPADWSIESLQGPILILSKERTAVHPKHGDVTFCKDTCINVTYQRNTDLEGKIAKAKD